MAYPAAFTFLLINGNMIEAKHAQVAAFILSLAAGEIDEEGVTQFLRDHCVAFPE